MGRIKRVREFGDPDYIRIDQAVFKFKWMMILQLWQWLILTCREKRF